jgi:hypothetical protein
VATAISEKAVKDEVVRLHLRRRQSDRHLSGLCRTRRSGVAQPPPVSMNSAAIATFVVIAGLVWGGFLLIIITAFRKESRKREIR